jgi:hypothetical protein
MTEQSNMGPPERDIRHRLPKGRSAIAAVAIISVLAGAGITEASNLLAGATSNSTIITGQVSCPSSSVQGMQFQTADGRTVSARLLPITTTSGSNTNWDHYSVDIPASAGGTYAYVAGVTCGRQSDWSPRITGQPASLTIICGEVDGECSGIVTNPATLTIAPAQPASQPRPPEQPHTPEPTHRASQSQSPSAVQSAG